MKNRSVRRITLILLLLIVLVAPNVISCNSDITQLEQRKVNSTKVVSHAFGQVEIPRYPQRIVVLEDYFLLDSLLALGVKPVGSVTCPTCIGEDRLAQFTATIPTVGDRGNPSLEKILSLKPDLILGADWQNLNYPLLSAIAPTVMLKFEKLEFKEDFRHIAQVMGKRDRGEAVLAEYATRVQHLRQKFETDLKAKTVSLIYRYGSEMSVYRPSSGYLSQILSDMGLQFTAAYTTMKDDFLTLSVETLPEYDADVLFVSVAFKKDSEIPNWLSFLKQPIWSVLTAIRNQQVYVGRWNYVAGPLTANQFFDDLDQYFVNISK